jgi:hypothetical protein
MSHGFIGLLLWVIQNTATTINACMHGMTGALFLVGCLPRKPLLLIGWHWPRRLSAAAASGRVSTETVVAMAVPYQVQHLQRLDTGRRAGN